MSNACKLSTLERAVVESVKAWYRQREEFRATKREQNASTSLRIIAWASLEAAVVVLEDAAKALMAEKGDSDE